MATRSLAGSTVRLTSLLGRSNLLDRNSGNCSISATGREVDLLDFPMNSFVPDQTPGPTTSSLLYTGKMSLKETATLLLQASFLGRLPHGTQLPGLPTDFLFRTSQANLSVRPQTWPEPASTLHKARQLSFSSGLSSNQTPLVLGRFPPQELSGESQRQAPNATQTGFDDPQDENV
jgi:hypothetical protein